MHTCIRTSIHIYTYIHTHTCSNVQPTMTIKLIKNKAAQPSSPWWSAPVACVCVRVCVWEREKEREKERKKEGKVEWERETEREREFVCEVKERGREEEWESGEGETGWTGESRERETNRERAEDTVWEIVCVSPYARVLVHNLK